MIAPSASAAGEEFYEMSAYAGSRLEGMLDATYFFNGRQLDPKFSINVLAGGELGYIQKENGYRPAKGGYTGFTGGLQLKYRLFGDVSVFLEPRASMASYSLKTNEKKRDGTLPESSQTICTASMWVLKSNVPMKKTAWPVL